MNLHQQAYIVAVFIFHINDSTLNEDVKDLVDDDNRKCFM